MREIRDSAELKRMSVRELNALAEEIRAEIIETVSEHGGHLASNLGAVELTLALHYVFDLPEDKLVFDVGHQAYTHKLLTGRLQGFRKMRTREGVSGFPQCVESDCDAFTAGHASTAISAALGMARTRDIMQGNHHVIAVVGDGALTGGMCYEALNDAGQSGTRLIVILNDNAMSISKNVGALSRYLTGLRQSRGYRAFKRGTRNMLERIPVVGLPIFNVIDRVKGSIKALLLDDKFFSALGFEYMGPIDGHNLRHMIRILKRARDYQAPVLLHVVTQKGKGYTPAEDHPDQFHGVVPFFIESGEAKEEPDVQTNGEVACQRITELAETDVRICGITAAMADGTGMELFKQHHPDRFFDVGIAEQHAVEMAAGMAFGGLRPYVAVYSTFLERAYDPILVDICRNSLPVTFLIDRAGLVGRDGDTHQGVFDLSYLSMMPNMIVAAPRDARDLRRMIDLSILVDRPMAIRYPKDGDDLGPGIRSQRPIRVGEWELLLNGTDVMIFAVGRMVQNALQAAVELMGHGVSAGVVDARFIKPMDTDLLLECARKVKLVAFAEENALRGGFGEGASAFLQREHVHNETLFFGVPDFFIRHGSVLEQQRECGLTAPQIASAIEARWKTMAE